MGSRFIFSNYWNACLLFHRNTPMFHPRRLCLSVGLAPTYEISMVTFCNMDNPSNTYLSRFQFFKQYIMMNGAESYSKV